MRVHSAVTTPLTMPLKISLFFLGSALIFSACAEKVVVCPDGYYVKNTFCYPDPASTASDAKSTADSGIKLGLDTKGGEGSDGKVIDSGGNEPDTATTGGKDTNDGGVTGQDTGKIADTKDAGSTDAGSQDTGKAKALVGAACADDLDCFTGLSCFSYKKGYCTLLNCGAGTSCPGSSVCWGKNDKTKICNADCIDDSDCRTAQGYGCKRLSNKFGAIDANLCLPGGKSLHGQLCKGPLDCEGADTCLTDMAGGYCARVGCSTADPCPKATACVMRDGKPTCLRTCTSDSSCQVGVKFPRTCVKRSDLSKKLVQICLDSAKAAAIGAECGADLDCDSGKCAVVSKGTCKTGDAPCLVDAQCGAEGPCVLDPKKVKGVCSQPCANDKGCPLKSVCVPGADSPLSGSCQPRCQGPGDTATCKVPGMECVFGQPIAPPNGIAPAGHACSPRPKGSPGAPCKALSDCNSKDCTVNAQSTAGFCVAACGGAGQNCPFGTKCISSGLAFCERMCSADVDCPPQMACKNSGQPNVKTCQLP